MNDHPSDSPEFEHENDNDEISFGEIREKANGTIRSPLNDLHYAVERIGGDEPDGGWPIFVELDVFLELECHARSNKNVELGGVLLGRQGNDENGHPVVLVEDSLRAEHYEATRGSFKFTHETWSGITRRRAMMNDGLQIIGWYHTHPGWGVFLSGMDDFICQNFFARPLDVALVIDPCQGTRGWFQWDRVSGKNLQSEGFWLISHRHRAAELAAAAACLNHSETEIPLDNGIDGPNIGPESDNSLSGEFVMNRQLQYPPPRMSRNPLQDLAPWVFLWIAATQTILMAVVLWRISAPTGETAGGNDPSQEQLTELKAERDLFREMAVRLSGEQSPSLVDRLAESESRQAELDAANISHRQRIDTMQRQLETASRAIELARSQKVELENQINQQRRMLEDSRKTGDGLNPAGTSWPLYYSIGATLVGLGGIGVALWSLNRHQSSHGLVANEGPPKDTGLSFDRTRDTASNSHRNQTGPQ